MDPDWTRRSALYSFKPFGKGHSGCFDCLHQNLTCGSCIFQGVVVLKLDAELFSDICEPVAPL